jgi:DNA-binding HxlR family transcriptional regulator
MKVTSAPEPETALPTLAPQRSPCPIAASLDIVGDRWSLLVIRDLLVGKRRYKEFLDSPEGITTNVLADRLRKLEALGLIVAEPYSQHPPRYEYRLTDRGRGLHRALQELCRWGQQHVAETWTPPAAFMAPVED